MAALPLVGSTIWIKALTCFPLQRRHHRRCCRADRLEAGAARRVSALDHRHRVDMELNGRLGVSAVDETRLSVAALCGPADSRTDLISEQNSGNRFNALIMKIILYVDPLL